MSVVELLRAKIFAQKRYGSEGYHVIIFPIHGAFDRFIRAGTSTVVSVFSTRVQYASSSIVGS